MTPRLPIVAIDGPAGSGKSTVAQRVARRAGLQFISSGALYRATALRAVRLGVPATDQARLTALATDLPVQFTTDVDGTVRTFLDGDDVTAALRDPGVGQIASAIAVIPALRAQIVARLRALGRDGGLIMEGRDIQTVVFPDADVKLFLTASAEERARRRWQELTGAGESVTFGAVLDEVRARDARDEGRDASPLRAAPDAILLDTDGLTIDQVVDCILQILAAWQRTPSLRGDALARAAGCAGGTH